MIKSQIFFLIVFLFATSGLYAVEGDKAIARTKAMIESIKNLDSNATITHKNFEDYIDVVAIIDKAIAPHLEQFNPAQLKEFKDSMLSLVRKVAYPSSNEFVNTTKYEITGADAHDDYAIVNMTVRIEKEKTDMEIGYYWQDEANRLMLTDVIFDGDSLVKDYQNQFGRVIQKEGVDGLIRKVKEKLNQVTTSAK